MSTDNDVIAKLVARATVWLSLCALSFGLFWWLSIWVTNYYEVKPLALVPALALFFILWGHNIKLSKLEEK